MEKDLSIAVLLDFYGDLLTDKQVQALDLYYNEDFSLAEIAEPLGISRQGVRDSIKRGEKQLRDLEAALGLAQRFLKLKDELALVQTMFSEVKSYIQTYIHSDKLSDAVQDIDRRLADLSEQL